VEGVRSVELFAGAGGLALGCHLAGFAPELVVEWDRWACDTVRENRSAGFPLVLDWEVEEGDVRKIDWARVAGDVDLVAGGPPCQPFSTGGKHRAADDDRDMFPASVAVVRALRPRAFIFENVKGLTRTSFANYFSYILLQLTYPETTCRPDEPWTDHLHRLQAEHTGSASGLRYNVVPTVVNAADYGVPQRRERVFIVGFRSDVEADWAFPSPTHSHDALLYDQWVTGDYWARHGLAAKDRPGMDPRVARRVERLRSEGPGELAAWRTVRDALVGLPEPTTRRNARHLNHVLQPGARSYKGHTGSPLDLPAKTLKAGDHGVPGGENMLRRVDGSVRYFTVRESARLQTFPDRYELHGAWGEAMRQLGNAVPVVLAQRVAGSVAEHLAIATLRLDAADRRARRASRALRA
jgi:DNA (cytosine-5)-methyltransferase 1